MLHLNPPCQPNHPLSQHHPIEALPVPFAHNIKNAPNLYSRRRSLLLHLQQEDTMAFNFHGPWATRDAQGYARTRPPRRFLQHSAPSLSDRGEAVLTHDIRAWIKQLGCHFLHVAAEAPPINPPKTLPDTCEASKEHEDPALLRDLP